MFSPTRWVKLPVNVGPAPSLGIQTNVPAVVPVKWNGAMKFPSSSIPAAVTWKTPRPASVTS